MVKTIYNKLDNAHSLERCRKMEARTAVRNKWLKMMLSLVATIIEAELSVQREMQSTTKTQVKKR